MSNIANNNKNFLLPQHDSKDVFKKREDFAVKLRKAKTKAILA